MSNLIDGCVDFSGGQNAGLTSDRIAKNQYYKAINTTCQNGSLSPRDRFIHQPIEVVTKGSILGISYQDIFDKGKFQGERSFNQDQHSYLISVRGGIIFRMDMNRNLASVLRVNNTDRISMEHRRVPIAPAAKYMVIWDWPNMPVIIDNGKARRSNFYALTNLGTPAPEIPQTRLGVFIQSRLAVADGLNNFTLGDPVGDFTRPNAPISFEEVYLPGTGFTGQVFNLGFGYGNERISAMGFISSRNSQSKIQATNYGPLYVATQRSFHIYDAELPRVQWTVDGFGRLELNAIGIVGQRAHELVGSDVIFQDVQGHIHSLTKAQNDERSGWACTEISREVYEPFLKVRNKDLLDIGFVTLWNNRVYIGARPFKRLITGYYGQKVYDYAHQGMVVLNLQNVSTISADAAPVWDGFYTGINPMEATVVDGNLYITSKDSDGFNRTYKVSQDEKYDEWNGVQRDIRSRIYYRTFDCEQPFTEKIEHSAELNIGELDSKLEISLYRKPLHLSTFSLWDTFKFDPVCPNVEVCGVLKPYVAAGFKSLPFADPKTEPCNTLTNDRGSLFLETQLMTDITGSSWRIDKIKLKAQVDGESDSEGTLCDILNNTLPTGDCLLESDFDMQGVCPDVENIQEDLE